MTLSPGLRNTLTLLATAFAIGAPASQALTGWGMTQQAFSQEGDSTLRAAGYAFSIWGLIYAGLVAHAVAQLFGKANERLLKALAPAIIAIAGCGAWIIASGLNQRWLSVAIILVSAGSAWWALWRARDLGRSWLALLLHVWPLSVLGGWLLAASALNILTVLTAEGMIGRDVATPAAVGGILAVGALAGLTMRAGVSPIYGVPVAWGLAAVFVAQRGGQPVTAFVAAGVSVLVGLMVLWSFVSRRNRFG